MIFRLSERKTLQRSAGGSRPLSSWKASPVIKVTGITLKVGPRRRRSSHASRSGGSVASDFHRIENRNPCRIREKMVCATGWKPVLLSKRAKRTVLGVPPTLPMSCQYSAECLISFAHHGPGGQSPPPLEWAQLSCGNLRLSFKIQNPTFKIARQADSWARRGHHALAAAVTAFFFDATAVRR